VIIARLDLTDLIDFTGLFDVIEPGCSWGDA